MYLYNYIVNLSIYSLLLFFKFLSNYYFYPLISINNLSFLFKSYRNLFISFSFYYLNSSTSSYKPLFCSYKSLQNTLNCLNSKSFSFIFSSYYYFTDLTLLLLSYYKLFKAITVCDYFFFVSSSYDCNCLFFKQIIASSFYDSHLSVVFYD